MNTVKFKKGLQIFGVTFFVVALGVLIWSIWSPFQKAPVTPTDNKHWIDPYQVAAPDASAR